jgi:hypothetical protein
MKKFFLALVLPALLFIGCKKGGISFSISDETTIRVESSSPLNLPFELTTMDVTTNSQQEFENNRSSKNLVKEVYLDELKLTITSPSSKTFSFLKNIQIFISTDANNEIELASLDNIASTAQSISLNVSPQNLEKYIKASSYKIRTKVTTKETLTQAVDIKAAMKFKVIAGL